ncbi:MAG: peptidylprolyl isomerase, partial [Betaproteobacteria bacterium]|nr:peptidylprolyl isomerase [Betaproteobacteria bacterium]
VNGTAIPRARLEYLMRQQLQRGAPDNDQTRAVVREDLINRELVAQAAARAGVAKKRDVQTQLDVTRQEVLVGAYLNDYLKEHAVTDADVQKEYDRVREQTGASEYKARHILLETEDEAKRAIAELQKGAKFDELAKKSSKDEGTRELGGDLDWKVPSTLEKPFADAMVALEKGKFSAAPVRTRFGFHVIQLDDVRPVSFPPLAQVKPQIQQRLVRQKVEELVQKLRAAAKVE